MNTLINKLARKRASYDQNVKLFAGIAKNDPSTAIITMANVAMRSQFASAQLANLIQMAIRHAEDPAAVAAAIDRLKQRFAEDVAAGIPNEDDAMINAENRSILNAKAELVVFLEMLSPQLVA